MLSSHDREVAEFFAKLTKRHPFKVGMDSCSIPGVISFCDPVDMEYLDTCEGGRFSCYISPDMKMVPCSFDQEQKYGVSLRDMTIEEAWNSESFEQFRKQMSGACPSCGKRELCMGGCPLMPEIALCKNKGTTTQKATHTLVLQPQLDYNNRKSYSNIQ